MTATIEFRSPSGGFDEPLVTGEPELERLVKASGGGSEFDRRSHGQATRIVARAFDCRQR
jgi:hypothetical protein